MFLAKVGIFQVSLSIVFTQKKRLNKYSPIAVMKTVKNEVELQGMRTAHVSYEYGIGL